MIMKKKHYFSNFQQKIQFTINDPLVDLQSKQLRLHVPFEILSKWTILYIDRKLNLM